MTEDLTAKDFAIYKAIEIKELCRDLKYLDVKEAKNGQNNRFIYANSV